MIFNFNYLSWVDNDHNIASMLSSDYNTNFYILQDDI